MSQHAYLVQVSRAAPGLFQNCHDRHGRPVDPMHYILHCLPLVTARGILHTAAILDGQAMTWTDPALTSRGRWWMKLREMWNRPA